MQQWDFDLDGQGQASNSTSGSLSFNGCVFSALKALSRGEQLAFGASIAAASALLAASLGGEGGSQRCASFVGGHASGASAGAGATGDLPLRCRMVGLLGDAGHLRWRLGLEGTAGVAVGGDSKEAVASGALGILTALPWLSVAAKSRPNNQGYFGAAGGPGEYSSVEPLTAVACR